MNARSPNTYRARRRHLRLLVATAVIVAGVGVAAQESTQITVPAIVSFEVLDVSQSTVGDPSPTTLAFGSAVLDPGRALRISVKAESDLTPPAGASIPASRVSWTASNAFNGFGSHGTLSAGAYTTVFQSQVDVPSGQVDLVWTLAPVADVSPRGGSHHVTLRWRVESIVP